VLEARTSGIGDLAGATVADTAAPAKETAPAGAERSREAPGSDHEPVLARDADSRPPASQPPPPDGQQPASESGEPGRGGAGGFRWRPWYAALLVAIAGGAVAAVLLTSSSSPKPGQLSSSSLAQVPTNHVTGAGSASVRLNGNVATVTLTTNGLDNNDALTHAMHIHAGGKGQCPPASAAQLHNGHRTISTTDGINFYGPPVQALTTTGDTSTKSILAFPRYPTGGTLRYSRIISLPPPVAAYVRQNNAVIVVHGIDYDHSGIYSGVLDRSELNKSVPATATAPALCGVLIREQRVAELNRSSRGRSLVYSASLVIDTAVQSVSGSGLFACEAADATAAVATAGRRGSAKDRAQSAARA
jgi:hypothetical protein